MIQRKAYCACGGECPACQTNLGNLKISQPNDPAEIEADQIADKVMRMPVNDAKPQANLSNTSDTIHRKCDACEEEEGDEAAETPLMRKAAFASAAPTLPPADTPPSIRNVISSGGQPLDVQTRNFFEPRFGTDLSHVRIHTDSAAAQSARSITAKAATLGNNIVFGNGEYKPDSELGRHLLAHELAHTIQQSNVSGATHSSDSHVSLDIRSYGVGLSRTPDEDRAKAVAEAEAVIAGMEETLKDDGDDDESSPKRDPNKYRTPSRFRPGGFTDHEAEKVYKEAEDRTKLLLLALTLAERQARRREFQDGNPSHNSANVKEAFDLDLYWDPTEEGFYRQPYVSKQEAVVDADPEANSLYRSHLWDLTENKPVKKSRFKKVMDFVCEHTNPCHDNMKQYRADIESGMSVDDARARGLFRIGTTFIPSRGPRGPIDISKGGPSIPLSSTPYSGGLGKLVPVTPGGRTLNPGSARQTVPLVVPTKPFPIPERPSVPKSPPQPSAEATNAKTGAKPVPKPTPDPAPTPKDPNVHPIPVPIPQTGERQKREKKCKDICSVPLPIRWPKIMPLPDDRRPLVRTPSGDENAQPDHRSKPQRDLQKEITTQLERHRSGKPGAYVPRPCFAIDSDPNDFYDAHHIHPLYLGGAEDDNNLCALRRDKHQRVHPGLNNQNWMLRSNAVWISCKVCSGYISDHLGHQEYEIDG